MTNQSVEFTVDAAGERLDKLIVNQVGDALSRVQIQSLIKEGDVTVDGIQVKPGIKLKVGQIVRVQLPEPTVPQKVQPEAIDLVVLYEDDDLAVIDKPAGMTVHPGVGNETGTVVAALLSRWPQIGQMQGEEKRAGIVHRLDKDTSGILLIAKNDVTRRRLMAQFQARTVEKTYLALLERKPPTESGRVEAPIARDPNQRKRMAVQRGGKPAITEYQVIDTAFTGDQALVKINLLTGRTHQIRVHMAFIGAPIVGDRVYGFRKQRVGLRRHFLHAASLTFDHPVTGERLRFEIPLPAGLQNVLEKLRQG